MKSSGFLEPRLMVSCATVVIPLYGCVVFVRPLHGAELICWFSKIPQPLDAIPGRQFRVKAPRADRAMDSWCDLSQEPLRGATKGAAELCAASVSLCGCEPYFSVLNPVTRSLVRRGLKKWSILKSASTRATMSFQQITARLRRPRRDDGRLR